MKDAKESELQGEGDHAAARRYDDNASSFASDDAKVQRAAADAKKFVESEPAAAAKAEAAGKAPLAHHTTVDELVAKSRGVVDRVRPMVDRAITRVKSALHRR